MRKKIFLALLLAASLTAGAEEKVKTGWNFGVLPAVSFNSDLGLQYGVTADIYNYGDGSTFPRYKHKFTTEISHYTKGMTRLHLFYDSKYLIPGIRVTSAATFMNNPMFSFYGFNGSATEYVPELNSGAKEGKAKNEELVGLGTPPKAYYNFKRNMFRFLLDFQGEIAENLNWAAGVSYWNFNIGSKTGEFSYDGNKYAYSPVDLYNVYKASGIIKSSEAEGGSRVEAKAGVVYDTRDLDSAPTKGMWAELYLNGSPDLFGDGASYLKLCAHFRQYVPVLPDNRMTFAYHLAYQGTVAGETPWYMQQNITTLYLRQILSEGLGSINTVRGCLYNRFIGDSYAWGNFELRIKLLDFNFINQSWYLATNPFFDLGAIVKPYRADELAVLAGKSVDDYTKEATKLHESAGLGIKLVMNRNFIVSCEVAKPFHKEDNPGMGVNIGLNYIF